MNFAEEDNIIITNYKKYQTLIALFQQYNQDSSPQSEQDTKRLKDCGCIWQCV
jgi:hypothetical protein